MCPYFLQTGFRLFFLGASLYAVVSMLVWLMFYVLQVNVFVAMPLTVWHAHEMIFGFTAAVIAGFLLTAVIQWTGRPTLSGMPLLALFVIWLMGRVFAFIPAPFPVWPMCLCDAVFLAYLFAAVTRPIVAARQKGHSSVLSKLGLMLACACVFFLAFARADLILERKSLRFCVYMIVGMILTIGRRIIPFFVERGVGQPVTVKNSRVLDLSSLVLLVVFVMADVFLQVPFLSAAAAFLLVVVHAARLINWHNSGIWSKPLLWVLFAGYGALIVGFLFKGFVMLDQRMEDASLHAMTAGSIGLFTLGMMARVSWGHTGRAILQIPTKMLLAMFVPMCLSALLRVVAPFVDKSAFAVCIGVSQLLWVLAHGIFLYFYWPILCSARPDGKPG